MLLKNLRLTKNVTPIILTDSNDGMSMINKEEPLTILGKDLSMGITKNDLRNSEKPGYKSCCFHYLKDGPPKYICENDDYDKSNNESDCYPKDKKGHSLYEKMRLKKTPANQYHGLMDYTMKEQVIMF